MIKIKTDFFLLLLLLLWLSFACSLHNDKSFHFSSQFNECECKNVLRLMNTLNSKNRKYSWNCMTKRKKKLSTETKSKKTWLTHACSIQFDSNIFLFHSFTLFLVCRQQPRLSIQISNEMKPHFWIFILLFFVIGTVCFCIEWVPVLATMSAKVFFCRAGMFLVLCRAVCILMKTNQQSFGIQMVVYCVCSPFFLQIKSVFCAVWFVLYISFIVFI